MRLCVQGKREMSFKVKCLKNCYKGGHFSFSVPFRYIFFLSDPLEMALLQVGAESCMVHQRTLQPAGAPPPPAVMWCNLAQDAHPGFSTDVSRRTRHSILHPKIYPGKASFAFAFWVDLPPQTLLLLPHWLFRLMSAVILKVSTSSHTFIISPFLSHSNSFSNSVLVSLLLAVNRKRYQVEKAILGEAFGQEIGNSFC